MIFLRSGNECFRISKKCFLYSDNSSSKTDDFMDLIRVFLYESPPGLKIIMKASVDLEDMFPLSYMPRDDLNMFLNNSQHHNS